MSLGPKLDHEACEIGPQAFAVLIVMLWVSLSWVHTKTIDLWFGHMISHNKRLRTLLVVLEMTESIKLQSYFPESKPH